MSQICGWCYYRNPASGYCPKKDFIVERHSTACACYVRTQTLDEIMNDTKQCKVCGRELPISAFGRSSKTADGHTNTCRECTGKKVAESKAERKMTSPVIKGATIEASPITMIPAAALVAELRARGFEVKCIKTTVEEL